MQNIHDVNLFGKKTSIKPGCDFPVKPSILNSETPNFYGHV
jgi:hypothetical protein